MPIVRARGKPSSPSHPVAMLLPRPRTFALLEQFARDNRIRIRQPKRNLQKKIVRKLPRGNEFLAYVDAIGTLDSARRLLEWKTRNYRHSLTCLRYQPRLFI